MPDIVVGVWKPIEMSAPVCDNALALIDASSWKSNKDLVDFGVTLERPKTHANSRNAPNHDSGLCGLMLGFPGYRLFWSVIRAV